MARTPSTRATRCSAIYATCRRSTSTSRSISTSPARRTERSRSAASTPIPLCEEVAMAIVRLIFVTVKAEDAGAAERVWKNDCAPLMIKQKGCQSEELPKPTEVKGEVISYAALESQ